MLVGSVAAACPLDEKELQRLCKQADARDAGNTSLRNARGSEEGGYGCGINVGWMIKHYNGSADRQEQEGERSAVWLPLQLGTEACVEVHQALRAKVAASLASQRRTAAAAARPCTSGVTAQTAAGDRVAGPSPARLRCLDVVPAMNRDVIEPRHQKQEAAPQLNPVPHKKLPAAWTGGQKCNRRAAGRVSVAGSGGLMVNLP